MTLKGSAGVRKVQKNNVFEDWREISLESFAGVFFKDREHRLCWTLSVRYIKCLTQIFYY